MLRLRGPETAALRERWLAQGRGAGIGAEYKPWIKVGDFPNRTNSYRIKSLITGRVHHYFSAIEYRHHLVAEYLQCKDIREGFPLHPISETLALAHENGIEHPSFGGHVCSLTTDCLLTIDDGHTQYLLPRSLKYKDELRDPRVQENLEIERRFWEHRGRPWELLTEVELPEVIEKNLRWMRGWQRSSRQAPSDALLDEFLFELASRDFQLPLTQILEQVATNLHVGKMLAIYLFKYATWHRIVEVDLYSPLELSKPHLALRSGTGQEPHASKKRSSLSRV